MPRFVYDAMPCEAQLLFRHNVEDEPDGIHLEKHLQSMRNWGAGGVGNAAGWKSKKSSLNEGVKEHVLLGAEALKEMEGGSQPHAWKPCL